MWKKYKLSDIGTIVGGATPSTTVDRFYGGDIPWLTPKDLSNFQDRYIERGERNITQEGLDSCSAQLLPANSVLFSSRAPIGYVAIAKNPIATNQGFKSIIPNERVDSLFLYYILRYNKEKIEAMGSGTTFKEVSGAVMKNVEISLPSLEEQRRIAGILGAIDDKIENNRRINTSLELQAQALFDNLMSNSNLEYKLIVDIDHIIETGRRPKGGVANITSGVPSIGAENIKGLGKYDYSKTKYITAEFAETLKKGIIKGYELLIYKDGGKPGYFIPNFSIFGEGFPYDNMTLNEHVFLLDFGNKGYNFFAYFYMQTEEVMKYLNAQGSKAAIPGINRNDVENISIPTIENEAVKEFCERISIRQINKRR